VGFQKNVDARQKEGLMNKSKTGAALLAGLMYFLGIFALGFVLGIIRTLVLIPRIGALAGVLLEIPVLLTVSWFFCRRILTRFSITGELKHRFTVGGSAFILLMITEVFVSVCVFKQPWAEYCANVQTLPGFLGLLAQIVFGCIPMIQKNSH
jgi:hypothetical protein